MVTKEQVAAGVKTIAAIAEAIRDLGEIPAGHLYGRLAGMLTIGDFERIIAILERTKLIEKHGHLLVWTGPQA